MEEETSQFREANSGEERRNVKGRTSPRVPYIDRLDRPALDTFTLGGYRGNDKGKQVFFVTHEMDLSYDIPRGMISERVLNGMVDKGLRSCTRSIVQDQVYRGRLRMTTEPLLPVLQSVSTVGPKLRGVGRDLEPMIANEEEVVRVLAEPIEVPVNAWSWIRPKEDPGKDISKDFWGHAGGYFQQRISGAFELDCVPLPFFYLPLQFSDQLDVGLLSHAGRYIV